MMQERKYMIRGSKSWGEQDPKKVERVGCVKKPLHLDLGDKAAHTDIGEGK